ncbi:hypothetical protein JMUB6875_01170 [Nocardia sp. JMUB6875]
MQLSLVGGRYPISDRSGHPPHDRAISNLGLAAWDGRESGSGSAVVFDEESPCPNTPRTRPISLSSEPDRRGPQWPHD